MLEYLPNNIKSLIQEVTDNNNGWFIMEVCYSDNQIKPSEIYRLLHNSKSSVGGVTNRDYFKKNSTGGFYSYYYKNGITRILFCLRSKTLTNIELKVRTRKIIPKSDVRIIDSSEIRNFPFSDSKIQLIGVDYFNQMSL